MAHLRALSFAVLAALLAPRPAAAAENQYYDMPTPGRVPFHAGMAAGIAGVSLALVGAIGLTAEFSVGMADAVGDGIVEAFGGEATSDPVEDSQRGDRIRAWETTLYVGVGALNVGAPLALAGSQRRLNASDPEGLSVFVRPMQVAGWAACGAGFALQGTALATDRELFGPGLALVSLSYSGAARSWAGVEARDRRTTLALAAGPRGATLSGTF